MVEVTYHSRTAMEPDPRQDLGVNARPLAELVHSSWLPVLQPHATTVAGLGEFLRDEIAEGHSYQPDGASVLRAFSMPLSEVRVLVVCQDPYPTPGHAVGLSFSVALEVRPLPRSLRNIFVERENDLGLPVPTSGDLSPWTEQGVLLLNRVLTVRSGASGSHRGRGWEAVTEAAIRGLVARGGPLVAVLWGRDAAALSPILGDSPRIASAHPSPMSAARGFFGSRPFSRVNDELRRLGAEAVDWRVHGEG